jgi:hypothetical protein
VPSRARSVTLKSRGDHGNWTLARLSTAMMAMRIP